MFPKRKHIVFDPLQDIYNAREDPDLFLDNFKPPIILDEIQYVPELIPAIKRRVDESEAKGQYILTGSQNITILKNISESMAGRVGILRLDGMTPYEMLNKNNSFCWLEFFLNQPQKLVEHLHSFNMEMGTLTEFLWRGNLPGLLDASNSILPDYLNSYIQTYIERDIRQLSDIKDLQVFRQFLGIAAALTAQEINTSQLGREIGISPKTAKTWLKLLMHTYKWIELSPYSGNAIKRISSKKKGFLSDSGITCFLQRISSPEALHTSLLRGAIFESWGVNFILRQATHLSVPPLSWHWRTNGGAEIDLLLERDGIFYPIEIKCKTKLSKHDTRGIMAFHNTYKRNKISTGMILYAGDSCYFINSDVLAIPWNGILSI